MSKFSLFVMLILSLLLTACNSNGEQNQATVEVSPTLRISSPDAIKVAALAIRSASAANDEYGGIISYLETTIGRPFTLVPVTQEDQFTVVANGEVDFTLNNPLAAIQIQRLYDTQLLATLSRANTGPYFSSSIIVRADSGIETLEDLRGKNGTCVDFETAAAGCVFQVYHLRLAGIDPYTDFASFVETPSQDNIVLGVLNGTFDVGFVRTGQLEKMLREGTILSLEDFRILDQAQDDFAVAHTTALYPEWPFAALPATDTELIEAVQSALLAMPSDHPALAAIGANGWVEPLDYASMNLLIEELKLYTWDVQN